jgi:hypothetical protein
MFASVALQLNVDLSNLYLRCTVSISQIEYLNYPSDRRMYLTISIVSTTVFVIPCKVEISSEYFLQDHL